MYWNKETGKYDLMRQLQDMADARERMKDMPRPVFNVKYNSPNMENEIKLDDVHPEIRKLAVAWGQGKDLDMIETMQLGMQIQYVFDKIKEDEK